MLNAKPETWHEAGLNGNEVHPEGTVPAGQPVAHVTIQLEKVQLLVIPGVQPKIMVVEEVALRTGARTAGGAAGTAVDTVALTAENALSTVESLHNNFTLNAN